MFDSKFVHMVKKLTQNHGIDYAILSKEVSNRLPELLADEAKIIITEDTDLSVLSSIVYNLLWLHFVFITMIDTE